MSEEEDQSIPYLTSPAEVVSVAEKETVFDLARECIDQDCGYWSLPPPGLSTPFMHDCYKLYADCNINVALVICGFYNYKFVKNISKFIVLFAVFSIFP